MDQHFTKSTIIGQSQGIVFNQIDDDLVLFDPSSGEYYRINPVGAAIWGMISKETSFSDLIEQLMAEYEIDRSTCENETLIFLNQIIERGFARSSDES